MDDLREWLNLPPQGGAFAVDLDAFHLLVVGICFAGSLAVAVLALWWAVRYRRGSGRHRPATRTRPLVEIGLAGGLMLLFVAWWGIGWYLMRDLGRPRSDALDIQVVAKQWMWKIIYPDGRELVNELVLPVGRPVHLHITSRDVIHSLYLPAFRLKQDAVPQRTTHLYLRPREPGVTKLFCAEYCGLDHSNMTGAVRVLAPADWATWRATGPVGEDLVARGRHAAIRHGCLACHTTDGSPHIGPSWQGRFGTEIPLADGGTALVDGSYLTRAMMDPGAEVAAGYRDVMPSYHDRLDPVDAAAIVAFIKAIDAGALDGVDSSETAVPLPDRESYW